MDMPIGVPRTSAERKTELLKPKVDERGQGCQSVQVCEGRDKMKGDWSKAGL